MGGSVYAFAGGKGGVGKTTVTANVAISLQQRGKDVAIVDADVGMTNLADLLGIQQESGIHEVLSGEKTVTNVTVEGPDGLTVVPGEEGIDAVGDADPANLRDVVDPLTASHDIVLLDTGAGLNHQNLVAYGLADAVVMVTTQGKMAVSDTEKTRQAIESVEGTIAGAVITRVEPELVGPQKIAEGLDADLLGIIPEYQEHRKEPRVQTSTETPAATEYQRLATAITVYDRTGDSKEAGREAHIDQATVKQTQTNTETAENEDEDSDSETDEQIPDGNVEDNILSRLTTAVTER